MSAMRSAGYRRVVRQVLAWCRWYTRDLAPDVIDDRLAEIGSDLYEHGAWADGEGQSAARVSRDIFWRMVRGIPADLSWRARHVRAASAADPAGAIVRRVGGALAMLVAASGAAITVFGVAMLGRIAIALVTDALPGARLPGAAFAVLAAATLVAVVGCALAGRRAVRHMGALLLAIAAPLISSSGAALISLVSVTGGSIVSRLSMQAASAGIAQVLGIGLGMGVGLCLLGAATWWWPRHADVRSRPVGAR
ncbi:hypothetical protein ACL9RL_03580 [Plantibacter sp. Mn2098]|uniref:hypothetical protein n=1 Tax=Plantibacter sp. Mn2098 TaxID=3395266 RepID=UPI003BD19088